MEFRQAQELAWRLMKEHGLDAGGWRFRWSHGKRQLGCAQVARKRDRWTGRVTETKTIKLSRNLVALNSEPEVRETILHEIAHAIAGIDHGHDEVWKAACRRVGAKPVRLADESVALVRGRYTMYCGHCQNTLGTRHRRMRADVLERSYCRVCGPVSKGMLRIIEGHGPLGGAVHGPEGAVKVPNLERTFAAIPTLPSHAAATGGVV